MKEIFDNLVKDYAAARPVDGRLTAEFWFEVPAGVIISAPSTTSPILIDLRRSPDTRKNAVFKDGGCLL